MRLPLHARPFALWMLSLSIGAAGAAAGGVAGCGSSRTVIGNRDAGDGEPPDLSISFADDAMVMGACVIDGDCPPGERCVNGTCERPSIPCNSDDECQDDTYCRCAQGGGDAGPCMGGECAPWGSGVLPYDPDCAGSAFLPSAFKPPKEKCHWVDPMGGPSNVIMTPLVVDLDRDRKPEIVFQIYQGNTTVAIRGDTCKEVWRVNIPSSGFTQLAAADFDADGFPEIVVPGTNNLLVIDHNGKTLATGPAAGGGCCGGPAIADVDGVSPPEIGMDGAVYKYANGQITQLWTRPASPGTWGTVSLFADMDGNGTPELVTGLEVYDGLTGADKTPAALRGLGKPGGYPAVADFNRDGKPDIVMVQSAAGQQRVTVVDYVHDKIIFGPYTIQNGGGWGGAPTVGDYDGDGVPDIGLASQAFYYVYALKCGRMPKPKDCTGVDNGVLWQRAIHDQSSGGTASSTFDFNGDGVSEVIYRDECWFRVYNGPNGKTVFARPITSGTALEYSVIADVDSDGHADIVVPSDNVQGNTCNGNPEGQLPDPWVGPTTGIFVLTDPMNRWMPSRPLWHQHTYHITEIDDALRVPAHEKNSWSTWNTYRKNVQGMGMKAGALADFTGGVTTPLDNGGMDCNVSERLWANICNRGGTIAPMGIPGTFYDGDPRIKGAVPYCTAYTRNPITPGGCEAVYCDHPGPSPGPHDVWFRADDDGKTPNWTTECKPNNDLLYLPRYDCETIG